MTLVDDEKGVVISPPDYTQRQGELVTLAQSAAELLILREMMIELKTEIDALNADNQQLTTEINNLHTALEYMPCPQGIYLGLPEEGWTGRPEDAPGAKPANIEQCMAAGGCSCETGLILAPKAAPEGSGD
jgi:hypothetical protein